MMFVGVKLWSEDSIGQFSLFHAKADGSYKIKQQTVLVDSPVFLDANGLVVFLLLVLSSAVIVSTIILIVVVVVLSGLVLVRSRLLWAISIREVKVLLISIWAIRAVGNIFVKRSGFSLGGS